MKTIKILAETVLIILVISFILTYVFKINVDVTTSTVETIEEAVEVSTYTDSIEVTKPAVIIDENEKKYSEVNATFGEEGVYEADINVKYFFNEEAFNIGFNINIEQERVTVTRTITETRKQSPPLFRPLVGIYLSSSNNDKRSGAVGINVGMTVLGKVDIYAGGDSNRAVMVGLNWRF